MLLMPAPTPRLAISLMAIPSTAMPQTQQEPPSSHAGTPQARLQAWCPSSPTILLATLLELATWTMPMATPSPLAMATSWCPPTTMHLTTMQAKRRATSVDSLPKENWRLPLLFRYAADFDYTVKYRILIFPKFTLIVCSNFAILLF